MTDDSANSTRRRDGLLARRDVLRLAALAPVVATSCTSSLLGGGVPPQLYVLSRKTSFAPDLPMVRRQLLVERPDASAELDTSRIALSNTPTTLDYFADAAWTDRGPAMVQQLLIESFEQSGKITAVSRDVAALRADYLLLSELRRFTALYNGANAPPTVFVRILVRLVKMPDRTIIGQQGAERRLVAPRNDMATIVETFDDALGGVMKDLVEWTLRRMYEDGGSRAEPGGLSPRPR
jgi:cholesterol transport system auxiliary component